MLGATLNFFCNWPQSPRKTHSPLTIKVIGLFHVYEVSNSKIF